MLVVFTEGSTEADRIRPKDASPIQIIGLGPDSKISQTYEESQVKGSFKLVSQNMVRSLMLGRRR